MPIVISIGIFISIILYKNSICRLELNVLFGASIALNLILHSGNKVFNFCKWHIALIYYIYSYCAIILIDYYFPDIYLLLDYIDYIILFSLIVFIISFLNRNKS